MYNNEDGHSSGTSVAETVMVHMVFAIMFFQYASRNWEDALQKSELNDLSNRHYHYALSYYSQLVASHTLQDVQALTLICLHLRSFPKPGACWMMTSMTFSLAIDLGLHRSARQWSSTTPKKGMLEIEMRKRIFWSVLTIHVIISGKLGRPMALRFDDFDVEIPEALDDNLLDENGLDTSKPGKCGFLVGLEAFKCQSIFMDLYNNIYTVRRSPRAYIPTVRRLDRLIRQWSEQWPSQLLPESASNDEEGRVHVQYLNIWLLEFRLLLRHPSLSLTGLEDFNHENLAICMEVSGKMLQHVKQIQKYRSLDTNWQTGALYVLAISTTLFGYWENKDELTSAGFATLKADMDAWLSIMGDVGDLLGIFCAKISHWDNYAHRNLGSGKRLQEVVRVTVDGTLGLLASHLASKTASSALTATASHIDPPAPSAAESHSSNPISYPIPKSNGNEDFEIRAQNTRWSSPEALSAQNHYSDPPFTYPEPPAPNMPQYHPNMTSVPASNPNSFPNASSHANSFQPSSPYSQPHDNPRALATAATTYLFSNPPSITSSFQPPVPAGSAGSTSWRHFAGNMVSSLEPPEYVANALMQLGGHAEQEAGHNSSLNVSTTVPAHGVSGLESSGGLTTGQPWPLMIFESPRT